ncbi:MAG: PhnD/SsuA/transferrin family substrate-binding protein [Rhizobiales bacterium]|nr:PhnD/SsuA/transferrin family substrate-binding protein [Hyphomicrobiales bacterium]MBI3672255.1 PhnD/SsuA/transferrin family substrate-binding protein [Hyphomicrobiales bacterium]
MIATLPMYDWPEFRAATDSWWAGIARHLESVPPLARPADHTAAWRDPRLLFSQTCGYPFTHEFKGRLKLVATPHYGADGCEGPNYCSLVFAREMRPLADFRGRTAAVNAPDSMSGMLALQLVFAPLGRHGRFFGSTIRTGGHIASLRAVREGSADVCATDAVCVALARRYRPDYLEGLVEIARSPAVPALPYVTIAGELAALQTALARAFADPDLIETRQQLLLTGYSTLSPQAYDRIIVLESAMRRAGGLELL